MEWVETTGKTLEDAREAALDELGVDEQDAEFEVLEEPKLGLFGRLRSEGRVRARVRPMAPPAKDDRRRRGRSGTKATGSEQSDAPAGDEVPANDAGNGTDRKPAARKSRSRAAKAGALPGADAPTEDAPATTPAPDADFAPVGQAAGASARPRRNPERNSPAREAGRAKQTRPTDRESSRGEGVEVDVSLDEQSRVAEEFLHGLVSEFGVEAEIASAQPDESTLDLNLTGDDLGMLIGPKGATLLALQDLTRTVVQRRTGAGNGRIHVDVSGYRQKRSEALTRFARQVAEEVKSSGARKALEPMSAPDRKVVHDALTDVAGVSTLSEGEDAQRRVVIFPADDR